MARKVLLLVILIVTVFAIIGCQTVQGIGEDIKWTGEKGAEVVGQEK
jgi:predicted small secreted protein